jgi:gluconolactonase
VPDGLAVAADGRLFVTTVTSHGVSVVSPDGELLDHLHLDDDALPTNCCFEGSALWVTDFGTGYEKTQRRGRLWRVETDVVGTALGHGHL